MEQGISSPCAMENQQQEIMQGMPKKLQGLQRVKMIPTGPHWSVWEQIQSCHFPCLASQPLPAALVGVPPWTSSTNVAGREQHLVKQREREKNWEQESQGGCFLPGQWLSCEDWCVHTFFIQGEGHGWLGGGMAGLGWVGGQPLLQPLCCASASRLPSPGASWVEELQPNGAGPGVRRPGETSTKAEQTSSWPLLGEGGEHPEEPSRHHKQSAGEPRLAVWRGAGLN